MNILNSIFDGLYGYEKLMLICGFILFVFALAAITVMIVQRRDFKAATVLIIFAIVLMGFPGIQAIKINGETIELDRIREQTAGANDPAQQRRAQQTLSDLQQRSAGNPQLQAKVADGYRAIGDINTAYDLARSVLQEKPSVEVQKILVPVLTAKLNQVQASLPPLGEAAPVVPVPPASTLAAAPPDAGAVNPTAATPAEPAPGAAPASAVAERQHEIAVVAAQLQGSGAVLPAAAHVALAKAYVTLDQPQKAQANVDAARRINPGTKFSPAVLRATHREGTQ